MSRHLGIDYGTRRLGLAVSDPAAIVAAALRTVEVTSDEDALQAVRLALRETEAQAIVVGIPRNMDGTYGDMAQRAQAFARLLAQRLGVPVAPWDERLSTRMVERMLIRADVSRARRKRVRDKLAAQAILQGYLDSL